MTVADASSRMDFLAGGGEMGRRIRDFDWASTPLGPIENWPLALKTSVSLILSSRHPMWIGWGPEITFLYNDAYVHVLSEAKHPHALGRPASEVWGEIWDVCGPLADKVFENGEASYVDDVRLFMDRGHFLEETFYSFSYSPIRDEFGRVLGLFCPSTDVTPKVVNARRLATLSELSANALIEKNTRAACATIARTLSKNADDVPFALLYLADPEGRHARLEQVVGDFGEGLASATVNLDPKLDHSPWRIAEIYETAHRQTISAYPSDSLPRGMGNQRVTQTVVLPVTSRGEHRPYGVLVMGVNPGRPLDAGHLTFFELVAGQVATAIQNAKSAEDEKRRADMLAEVDRAKTVFFSNVSHEFRTPLTLMLGPLENLLTRPDGLKPADQEQIAIAHRNSLRLLKLVNSLLDFSRLEAGRFSATYAPTDLSELTAELASNFRSAMQAAGIDFVVECPPLPEKVYVDREMWEKIVLNLLSNAFKFTFAGQVAVRVRARDEHAVLTVSDTGIGIPENEIPRIFDRFHRVEGARGRTYEGTGIGLALIQEYVKLHGGAIEAASSPGKGSTFTVTLPFGTAHLPPDRVQRTESSETPAAARRAFIDELTTWLPPDPAVMPGTEPTGDKPVRSRILLADDNADMREHVSRLLRSEYEIITAKDGQEALNIIRRTPPDLLLTDVMMPVLDGIALLRALRADPATQELPVIFLSARAGEEMRIEGLEAGADDYVVKPFPAAELRARVSTHLKMASVRRKATEREMTLRAEAEASRDHAISVLESITDGFLALDKSWRITYVNAEAERLNGMRRETMLGRNHWDLFPATVGSTSYHELHRAATERITVDFEHYYEPLRRWFHVKAYPAADAGLSIFFEDITDRKAIESDRSTLLQREQEARRQIEQEVEQRRKTENLLRENEDRYRDVIDALPAAIYTTDAEGRLTHFNPAAARLSGRVPELGSDRWCVTWKLYLPDGTPLPHEQCPMAGVLKGLPVAPGTECIAERPDGSRFWFTPYPILLRNREGRVVGGVNMLVDITERKRAEESLRRSEELFRAIVDTTPECVKLVAKDGSILYMNPSGLRMVGARDQEEVIGKSVFDLVTPEFRQAFQAFNDAVCAGNKGSLEFDIIGLRQELRHMESHAAPLRQPDGSIVQLAISRDVTERRQRERASLLLGAIVDSSDDAIISKDLNGIITSWNKSAERVFGYTADEVIGKSITILIPPDRLHEEPNILSRLRRGLRVDHFETVRRRKDGVLLDISLTISPVKNPQGKIIGASKIARDVTDRKRAERAIQELNAQLTADLAALTTMQQLSTRMVQADNFPQLLNEIVEAGMRITDSDRGVIQLVEDGVLTIVSQRGFEQAFLDYFDRTSNRDAACGLALERKERVIVEDVAASPIFQGTEGREVMLAAGVRAVQSTPLTSHSGEVLGVFSTHYDRPVVPGDRHLRLLDVLARQAADLIERKRAEAALLASEERFRQLADSMPQFVWTATAAGHVDYYNERWYEFTGFRRDHFSDEAWQRILHPDDVRACYDTWRECVRNGEPFRVECRFWDRQETRWRWFMGRALPVRGESGQIAKWFGTFTDIDEQKRVEGELRRANQDLEQFAYSASHDLQEPLRSIRIYGELLERRYAHKLEGQASDFLAFLLTGASRMEMLVRDLLAYTQVTRVEDPSEDTDANAVLAATVADLEGAIAESGAAVTSDRLPVVRVHPTHLRQLFQNLIGNAIKYRSRERAPVVHVSAERANGAWIFSVRDNGIGINPQYKDHIFGIFKRLHNSDEYSGTGIGLAICQRIVERYHGRIWVESGSGQGSTFFFAIPG